MLVSLFLRLSTSLGETSASRPGDDFVKHSLVSEVGSEVQSFSGV